MKSSTSHQFSQIPHADIPRSNFSRSHGHKTTFDSGYLVPIFVDEALPGDTWNLKASIFARLSTPLVPIMDNLFMDLFWFAVPNRLVWDNWQRFMGEQPNPGDSTDFLIPQISAGATGFAELSLFDYMGVPIKVPNLKISALPLRAYNLIWNEWFRDQNLQDSLVVKKDDTDDLVADFVLLKRGKRHDYFTSALPWPQKGEAVQLPLGSAVPITPSAPGSGPLFSFSPNDAAARSALTMAGGGAKTNVQTLGTINLPAAEQQLTWGDPGLMADLSQATAATINDLREAFQIQKLLERDARGGTRYTEILRSHFGVVSPDARLQRPEFLGGGTVNITVNPVVQTSGTDPAAAKTPQGNLAAYGVAGHSGNGFTKSFVEHSILIGLIMVRADLSYQQGLNRMWSRRQRYDFYWPALAHLGEQSILNKEIFAQGPGILNTNPIPTPIDDDVFGYQERWAEYRYAPSIISGRFRSNATGPLDTWHLAQKFTTLPTLSPQFIEENPPLARVLAVQTEPQFLMDSYFEINATRPMPTYSVPGLIDHF